MNELLATVISGLIIDENNDFYFLQKNGQTFRLSKSEGNHEIGEMVEGFAYLNQKHEACVTTRLPKVKKGYYAFATVTEVRKDLGVFVDIGLSDKDMVVSCDELPTIRELWPKPGDQLLVSLHVDAKDRIWAVLADEKIFKAMARRGEESQQNANVTGFVYRLKLAGSYLLTEDYYIGFVHPSERYQEPRLGEKVTARVIGVRPDGVLNLSMKPRAHEAINDDAQMILAYLKRSQSHSMPYTDKSTPEEIKQMFGISKGQFKRALGHLMKEKLIEQVDGQTKLL